MSRLDGAGGSSVDPDLALLAGAVAAAGRVDGDAVPAGRVEQGHAVRNPHRPVIEDKIDPNGLGGRRPPPSSRGSLAPAPAPRRPAWLRPAGARCAAIQLAPHSSRFSTRSAALTARTICGARASMIALVSPWLMAMGRNAAAIECRSGMPKRHVGGAQRHVHAELGPDHRDRLDRPGRVQGVRADRHGQRVDHDVLDRDPYFSGRRTSMSLRTSSSAGAAAPRGSPPRRSAARSPRRRTSSRPAAGWPPSARPRPSPS